MLCGRNAAACTGVQHVRSCARGVHGTQRSAGSNFGRHERTAWFGAVRSVETTRYSVIRPRPALRCAAVQSSTCFGHGSSNVPISKSSRSDVPKPPDGGT
ncbi:hypothetical protein [Kitasatospora sp. NPDC059327]|uniref:hypothetical protein n=1 Tax=Kitasatospora sp. NPDC059327 TaxID=3346803 RepID=UPI00368C441D